MDKEICQQDCLHFKHMDCDIGMVAFSPSNPEETRDVLSRIMSINPIQIPVLDQRQENMGSAALYAVVGEPMYFTSRVISRALG